MSQRNPMNQRYNSEKPVGTTRKSAASAKPKTRAAASVTTKTSKKTPKEKKAEQKAARREAQERQREIDRKYYKPDTQRYRDLRRLWWGLLIGAVLCVVASFLLRQIEPDWIAMVVLFLAYAFIILAFYVDFSKIRKERQAYQDRMVALELEEAQKQKQEARRQGGKKANSKAESDSKSE